MVTLNYEIELVEGHFDAGKIYLKLRNNSWKKPPSATGGAFALLRADGLVRTSWSPAQVKDALGNMGQSITEIPDPMPVMNLQGDWQTSGPGSGYYTIAVPEIGNSADAQLSINWANLAAGDLGGVNLSKLGYDLDPEHLREMKLSFPQGILYSIRALTRLAKARTNSLIINRV